MPKTTSKRKAVKKAKPAVAGKAAAAKPIQTPSPATKDEPHVPAQTKGVSLPHTLAEVSRAAGVSATTIKYYLKGLPGVIEFSGQGRARRFSGTALQTLVDVRRMLDEGKSLAEVRSKLQTGSGAKLTKAVGAPAKASKAAAKAPASAAGSGRKAKKAAPAPAKATRQAKASSAGVSLDTVMGELKEIRALLAKLTSKR